MVGGNLTESQTETAFDKKNLGPQVGEYKINRIRIYSPLRTAALGSDSYIDIGEGEKAAWTEINFYEDIDTPIVTGDITIADAVGILEGIPILGEEQLEVRFATAGAVPNSIQASGAASNDTPNEKIITNMFRIHRADPPVDGSKNFRSVKLHFVSDLVMKNVQTEVQKSYKGTADNPITISDIARQIYYDSFCGNSNQNADSKSTHKEFQVEPTQGLYSAHIPNWTPFKAIQFLASKAQSSSNDANGAHFVFYETLKGYRFVSIETLMKGGFRNFDQITNHKEEIRKRTGFNYLEHSEKSSKTAWLPIYDKYTSNETRPSHVVKYIMKPANVGGGAYEQRFSATSLNVLNYPDTLRNLRAGMYANRVISHNLLTMEIYQRDYLYKKQKDIIRVDNPQSGVTTLQENKNKLPKDAEIDIDNFTTAEGGALCSEVADYLDRPATYTSLFPSNRGEPTKFGMGPKKTTTRTESGEIRTNLDLGTKTPEGMESVAHPIETDRNIEQVLGKRTSQQRQIEAIRIQFQVPGDSAREVGDLIHFSYPSDKAEGRESGQIQEHKYGFHHQQ